MTHVPLVVVVLASALAFGGCAPKETPEARIKKLIEAGAAALEERDAPKAAETLADDYKDAAGRSKKQLKQLTFFALQQGPVLVSIQNLDIAVHEDAATAQVSVLAVQGSAQFKTAADLLPTNARKFDLKLTLQREGSEWKVTAINGLPGGGSFE